MDTETKTIAQEIEEYSAHCNGSQDFHKHWLTGIYYTDGVDFVANKAGAYWLIDAIASHQMTAKVLKEEFQVWTLRCLDDLFSNRSGVLTMDDGNDAPPLVTQVIEYTDFPLDTFRFYLEDGSLDGVTRCKILMLPNER